MQMLVEWHQIILGQTTDIIFEWDIAKDTLSFSSNWQKKFGYDPISENISARPPKHSHVHPRDRMAFVKIMRDAAVGVPYSEAEFRIAKVDGVYCWCKTRATCLFDAENRPVRVVGVIIDVDREKRTEQKLLDKAQRDELTGLTNRMTTQTVITQFLKEYTGMAAMIMVDIDDFKLVNDRYGDLLGDMVLSSVGRDIQNLFRASDIIGRLGGDGFLVLLKDLPNVQTEEKKAAQLLKLVQEERIGEN